MKFFLLVLFFSFLNSTVKAQFNDYIWPTNASPYLSSTFAETRSAHFHAGLDIKTWGKEGYKVFASKSGKIMRMAITSKGYGRVLYMQHEDSTYTVYAHLQRFIPKLQSYIDSVRLLDYRFEVDVNVASKNWYFEQGEIIGFTGSTGIGPPHLHFEIRNKDNKPINALLSNLNIKDSIPPKITSVMVIPMSDTTHIDGSKFPKIYYPKQNSNGNLKIGTIEATGPVGIAIQEYDQAEVVTNKYASYEFLVSSTADTHFYSRHDKFDFKQSKTMFIDRIKAHGSHRRSFQTLFQEEEIAMPFYYKLLNKGILYPSSDTTTYTIKVNDFKKNSTSVLFRLIRPFKPIRVIKKKESSIYAWYWRNNWITLENNESINLQKNDFGKNWDSSKDQRIINSMNDELLITRIIPEKSHQIISPNRKIKIHFTSNSFFDSTSVALLTNLETELPSFSILPETKMIRNTFFVEFYLGHEFVNNQNYQLFHFDRLKNKYTYIPSKLIGRTVHGRPHVLGDFVIKADNAPPEIKQVKVTSNNYGRHQVIFKVEDDLSGINFEKSEIRVNGIRGIVEYDFEEDQLIYIHPKFEPTSRNRIELILIDNAGNSRSDIFYR